MLPIADINEKSFLLFFMQKLHLYNQLTWIYPNMSKLGM